MRYSKLTTRTIAQKKIVVEAICEKCDGTGVLPAGPFFPTYMRDELKGKGVICFYCEGTGRRVIEYRLFKGRKKRTGIKTVVKSRIVVGHTEEGFVDIIALDKNSSVTYGDFLKGRSLPE